MELEGCIKFMCTLLRGKQELLRNQARYRKFAWLQWYTGKSCEEQNT